MYHFRDLMQCCNKIINIKILLVQYFLRQLFCSENDIFWVVEIFAVFCRFVNSFSYSPLTFILPHTHTNPHARDVHTPTLSLELNLSSYVIFVTIILKGSVWTLRAPFTLSQSLSLSPPKVDYLHQSQRHFVFNFFSEIAPGQKRVWSRTWSAKNRSREHWKTFQLTF